MNPCRLTSLAPSLEEHRKRNWQHSRIGIPEDVKLIDNSDISTVFKELHEMQREVGRLLKEARLGTNATYPRLVSP